MLFNSVFRSNGFPGTSAPKATYSNHSTKCPKELLFGLNTIKYRLGITGFHKTEPL